MTDTAVTPLGTRTGTVFFERKVQPKQYEGASAGIYVQFEADPEDTDRTIDAAKAAFLQAKAIVFTELGIEAHLEESGVLVEQVQQAFPGAVATAAPSQPSTKPTPQPHTGDVMVKGQMLVQNGAVVPLPDWLIEQARKEGVTEVYDNRPDLPMFGGKRNAKSPWFKSTEGGREAPAFWAPKAER